MKPAGLAAAAFERAFSAAPQVCAWAPGRLNLIGEHVDYAGGLVLPLALDRGVTVAAGPGQPGRIRVHSDQYLDAGVAEFDPALPPPAPYTHFVSALASETGVQGADIAVVADLPPERGWSSSAAFAVAVASVLTALTPEREHLSALGLCLACQHAETEALGLACGLMDQYAAVFSRAGAAVLLDTLHLTHSYVPLNLGGAALLAIDSGQPRRLAESGYNQRRSELAQGLQELKRLLGDFDAYRDLPRPQVLHALDEIPPPLNMRLRHLLSEQERVEQAAALLPQGRPVELGQLLSACHWSLSEDYAVSTHELDLLVELLTAEAGVYGARLVGGGFGGGLIALAAREALPEHLDRALRLYAQRSGLRASWQEAQPGDGSQVLLAPQAQPQSVVGWLK